MYDTMLDFKKLRVSLDSLVQWKDCSTTVDINHGLLVVRFVDTGMLERLLESHSIKAENFRVTIHTFLKSSVDRANGHAPHYSISSFGEVRCRYEGKNTRTFFGNNERDIVERLVKTWKRRMLREAIGFLYPGDFFTKRLKTDTEGLSKHFNSGSWSYFGKLVEPGIDKVARDMCFLAYVAYRNGRKIEVFHETSRFNESITFETLAGNLRNDSSRFTLTLQPKWSFSGKKTKFWYETSLRNGKKLWKETLDDEIILRIYEKEQKLLTSLKFEEIDEKYQGAITGEKFGI